MDQLTPLNRQERDLANYKFHGHKLHASHTLTCSACGAPLVTIIVSKPDLNVTLKYRADCPHCGDHSFPKEIKGGIFLGTTDDSPVTIPERIDPQGEIVHIRTMKARDYEPSK
jgi:ribosomal protein L37E